MIKRYIIFATVLLSTAATSVVYASTMPPILNKTPDRHIESRSPQRDKKQIQIPASPQKAEIEVVHKWSPLGTAKFTDDIMTGIWDFDCETYDVTIEYDEFNSGWYRLVNPLRTHPLLDFMISDGGTFPTDKDYYMIIDASDPENVKIPKSEIGYSDDDGSMYFCSLSAEWESLGYTAEEVAGKGGKLKEGSITFPEPGSCRYVQEGRTFLANENGSLKIVLPGGTDYGISFNTAEGFCPDENGKYHVQIKTGDKVPGLKWGIFNEVTEENAASLLTKGTACTPNATAEVDLSTFNGRKAYMIAVTLDNNNIIQEAVYTVLYNPADDSPEWKFLCKGKFTDAILSSLLEENAPVKTVEVQQHVSRPGYFRIVDPYAGWEYEDLTHLGHTHSHYIYLDATNPENVVLEDSPVGVGGGFYGDFLVNSTYNSLLLQYGKEELDTYGYKSGGSYANNKITFDQTAELLLYPTEFEEWYPSDRPASFLLDMTPDPATGVGNIEEENETTTEYLTLQGIRTEKPSSGIIIIVKDGKAKKTIIR